MLLLRTVCWWFAEETVRGYSEMLAVGGVLKSTTVHMHLCRAFLCMMKWVTPGNQNIHTSHRAMS